MNPTTRAWATKAEADLATAERELQVQENPNFDAVCYHAKECALNYLKARLEAAEVAFPITSHLVVLLELCLELEPGWESFREHLRFLTTSANQSLEADSQTDLGVATQAVEMTKAFREEVKRGLENWPTTAEQE
jgi:HEPN domain-containing protein